ncbi:MAG: DUF4013 domain-containing protein [Thermomicrobiales bacterium]|nr:DUF4013 domain-containing protein [Thermomicrobiales bacterium]
MNIGQAFSFTFQDPAWIRKILILAVLFFIPIIGWLIIGGYLLRLLRNVINGDPQPLPEWDDWGGDIAGGLKALVVGFIWGIPLWIITGVLNSGDSFLLSLISSLVSIVYGTIQLSAMGDLARNGNIADALNARPLQRVLNNFSIWLVYIVGAFIFALFSLVGLIGLVIGIVFTLAIALSATMHLGGQAYRLSEGQAAPVAARF